MKPRILLLLILLSLAGCEDGCGINRDNHFRERDEYLRDKKQRQQQEGVVGYAHP